MLQLVAELRQRRPQDGEIRKLSVRRVGWWPLDLWCDQTRRKVGRLVMPGAGLTNITGCHQKLHWAGWCYRVLHDHSPAGFACGSSAAGLTCVYLRARNLGYKFSVQQLCSSVVHAVVTHFCIQLITAPRRLHCSPHGSVAHADSVAGGHRPLGALYRVLVACRHSLFPTTVSTGYFLG